MNTIKEVLRLKYLNNLSNRKVERLGLASKSAISNYTKQFEQSGLSIDEVLALDDVQFKKIFADSKKLLKALKNHNLTGTIYTMS